MIDNGHKETDKLIEQMDRKVASIYRQAEQETQKKLDDYLKAFERKDAEKRKKDAEMRKLLDSGKITQKDYTKWQEEYTQWRTGQIMIGKRWEEMRDTLAMDYHNANAIARSTVQGYMPEVYALNHNYGTFQVERASGIDTSYTLYDRQTVERLMREEPELLPAPGEQMKDTFQRFDDYKSGKPVDLTKKEKRAFDKLIADNKDIRWQEGQIQSVMTQAILQGESVPHMAQRVARTMGDINRKATTRYVRTAATGAQNAGRVDSYKRAESMGIELEQEWLATLDDRTRDEHRELDGQHVPVGQPFEVDGEEIRFPGDPAASGYLIWNCRCTLVPHLKSLDQSDAPRYSDIGDETYEQWKYEHSADYQGNQENIFGQLVIWDEKMDTPKWDEPKRIVSVLCSQYSTKLQRVMPGAHKAAGTVQISGTIMNLSTSDPHSIIHEFAHTISIENQTKFGLYDEETFWKEIKKVRREYLKEVGDDTTRWISSYEHSSRSIDEFMAESFALAASAEMGIPFDHKYGKDLTYANKVLEIIKKHFGK